MILDLRYPFLIVAGTWNPAVFTPNWIRTTLFDAPDQQNQTLFEVQPTVRDVSDRYQPVPESNTVYYSSNVGVCCDANQFELFVNELENDTMSLAEKTVKRVIELFPHTPTSSYGINYRFFDAIPDGEICDSLRTHEHFDTKLRVSSTEIQSKFFESNDYDINIRRLLDDEGFELDLNFHHSVTNISDLDEFNYRVYSQYFDKVLNLFSKQYNIDTIDTIELARHEF